MDAADFRMWVIVCLTFSAVLKCGGGNSKMSTASTLASPTEDVYSVGITGEVNGMNYSELDKGNPDCLVPWQYSDGDSCICGDIPRDILECNAKGVYVLDSYCITYTEEYNASEVGSCNYNFRNRDIAEYFAMTVPLKLNRFMCSDQYNRNGTLCGKCIDDYHPLVHSFDVDCIKCPNGKSNWWKFVLAAIFPLTLFYFAIIFLKINVTSSHLYSFVFYSQTISNPRLARSILLSLRNNPLAQKATRYVGNFYGIWNLDFFRFSSLQICLGTDTLEPLGLDLIVGVYPLMLMVLSYLLISLHDRNFKPLVIICKPFRTALHIIGNIWEVKTSIIDSFATFILLSNVKFLSVVFDLLVPVNVYQLNSTALSGNYDTKLRLYYDATLDYFGPTHLPYGILGVVVLLLFNLLPTMVLILYPFRWFQKLLNLLPGRWYILHTFVDSFQGCYKNGTEPGTRDCRWFASIFFIIRFIAMLDGALTENVMFYPTTCMLFLIAVILLVVFQPFKTNLSHYTSITAMFLLLLAVWYGFVTGIAIAELKREDLINPLLGVGAVVGAFPLFYISGLVLHWLYNQRRFSLRLIQTLRAWRRGYDLLQ